MASNAQSFSFASPAFLPEFPYDAMGELWPAEDPRPNLRARGLTEARCVFEYHHWTTSEERYDAFQHLINICMLKRGERFWNPSPGLRFVGTDSSSWRTARKDWENYEPYGSHKHATRGWLKANLPELIEKYSSRHITRRELLELIRMRDGDLLHVCNALVRDLLNAVEKQQRNTLSFSTLIEELDEDEKGQSATQRKTPSQEPDYGSAVRMLVRDKHVRDALPQQTRRTLELLFRKLDTGISAKEVIGSIARDLKNSQRTVKRHLAAAHRVCSETTTASGQIVRLLAAFVLPDLYGK